MRTMMYASFLLMCCFAISEQSCWCGSKSTQRNVCNSHIVVEAKIESYSENAYDRNYQISAKKFYKGKEEWYDKLADKTTLVTPKDFSVCGPVDLKVGFSYILTVYVTRGKMHNTHCDLQVEASKATNTLLEGLDGKYLKNCDCKIPHEMDEPQVFRSPNLCEHFHCGNRDILCARDVNGHCNWQPC
ncbi:metalloproteinase inhibitor 2-like [Mytilus trossulus]|uniref:metalloproteinase inhibitor 2-like n=1 Tax=Mytilus trossulus TaxID=6551 RepID=UPI003007714A